MSAHDLNFTKVAKVSDIPAGKMKAVKILDKDILVANVGGVFYAVADRCSHAGGGSPRVRWRAAS